MRTVLNSLLAALLATLIGRVGACTPTSRADYEKQTPMGRIAKAEAVAAVAMVVFGRGFVRHRRGDTLDGGMTL